MHTDRSDSTPGEAGARRRYTTAQAVVAAIDARRPGLTTTKQHLLLFFAQGHHLGWFGRPLFEDPLYATDRGVSAKVRPGTDVPALRGEAALNAVGYTVERYGALSPADLRVLIQASKPWRAARNGDAASWWGVIYPTHLRDWFRRPEETDDPDDERPNHAQMAEAMNFWRKTR